MYDVLIIGAGVSGSAVARELSRYQLKLGILERDEDVCCGTSKANSGIVHAGYDAKPGSLMAKLNVQGNQMMEELSWELDFPFQRRGSFVICKDEEGMETLNSLKNRGESNHVQGLEILSRDQVLQMEKHVTRDVHAALYAPTAGIVCPFGLNIALAENACENGAEFYFNTEVQQIQKLEYTEHSKRGFLLTTSRGNFETRFIVNAAGVYADVFHNMVSKEHIHIEARKGEYLLLDKCAGTHVSRTIFALPGKLGKGVLVTPTIHGNLLVGPTAQDTENKEGTNTTAMGLSEIREKAGQNVENLPLRSVITSFAGLRAHADGGDFLIGEVEDAPGFIDCAGIESPGLTSAPAIGKMVVELLRERMDLQENPAFVGQRIGILNPETLTMEERNQLIKKEPAYGTMICRCEMISEGEILDAIRRPLGARSLAGIKRRTRAQMGRCQAGFCTPKIMEILEKEQNRRGE